MSPAVLSHVVVPIFSQSNKVQHLLDALLWRAKQDGSYGNGDTVRRCSSFVSESRAFISLQTWLLQYVSIVIIFLMTKEKQSCLLLIIRPSICTLKNGHFLFQHFQIYWRHCPWSHSVKWHQNSEMRWVFLFWMLMVGQNVRCQYRIFFYKSTMIGGEINSIEARVPSRPDILIVSTSSCGVNSN